MPVNLYAKKAGSSIHGNLLSVCLLSVFLKKIEEDWGRLKEIEGKD